MKESKRICPICQSVFYCNFRSCRYKDRKFQESSCYCKKCYLNRFREDEDWIEFRKSCYYGEFNPSRRDECERE